MLFMFADVNADIVYFADLANHSSFAATAIPEPGFSSVLLAAIMLVGCRRGAR